MVSGAVPDSSDDRTGTRVQTRQHHAFSTGAAPTRRDVTLGGGGGGSSSGYGTSASSANAHAHDTWLVGGQEARSASRSLPGSRRGFEPPRRRGGGPYGTYGTQGRNGSGTQQHRTSRRESDLFASPRNSTGVLGPRDKLTEGALRRRHYLGHVLFFLLGFAPSLLYFGLWGEVPLLQQYEERASAVGAVVGAVQRAAFLAITLPYLFMLRWGHRGAASFALAACDTCLFVCCAVCLFAGVCVCVCVCVLCVLRGAGTSASATTAA